MLCEQSNIHTFLTMKIKRQKPCKVYTLQGFLNMKKNEREKDTLTLIKEYFFYIFLKKIF